MLLSMGDSFHSHGEGLALHRSERCSDWRVSLIIEGWEEQMWELKCLSLCKRGIPERHGSEWTDWRLTEDLTCSLYSHNFCLLLLLDNTQVVESKMLIKYEWKQNYWCTVNALELMWHLLHVHLQFYVWNSCFTFYTWNYIFTCI
jgi:hypothetical protein